MTNRKNDESQREQFGDRERSTEPYSAGYSSRGFGPGLYGEYNGEGLAGGTAFGPGSGLDYRSGFAEEEPAIRRYQDWYARHSRPGPHAGKGPKGYQRSDDRIREDISERLLHDSHIDARKIEVTVKNGEVTLEGTVDDRFQKRRADAVCDSVSGVKDVHNRLRIGVVKSASATG